MGRPLSNHVFAWLRFGPGSFQMEPEAHCVHPHTPIPGKTCTPLWKFNRSFESKLSCSGRHCGVTSGLLPRQCVLGQTLKAH